MTTAALKRQNNMSWNKETCDFFNYHGAINHWFPLVLALLDCHETMTSEAKKKIPPKNRPIDHKMASHLKKVTVSG